MTLEINEMDFGNSACESVTDNKPIPFKRGILDRAIITKVW